jgi:2-methylcitrate dehydratase PrpD
MTPTMTDQPETISRAFARFARGLRYEDIPADVQRMAQVVLLDTLGCALAGAATGEMEAVRRAMARAGGGKGNAIVWGTRETAPLPLAALLNGAAAHAREMDDFGGCAHSGAVVIPAALGVGAQVGASGRELLTAIVIGYDVARRVMEGGGGYLAFKKRGWHSTSVCGVFGAAAAAGRLLGLSEEQHCWALGIAGSTAAGTWAFVPDGAFSKRLHPGLAAQSGVVAACLAAENVSGPLPIFETDWGGFFPTYTGQSAAAEQYLAGLGADFRLRIVGLKPYAACRGIHSSIEAVLALREKARLRSADVDRVVVRGSGIHVRQLAKQVPRTVLDAQLSLPYGIAVSLATGGAMLDQYTPDALGREEVVALARKVDVVRDEGVADGEQPFVDVHLKDGRTLTERVLIARGDYRSPLDDVEILQKFRTTGMQSLGARQLRRLEKAAADVAALDQVGALARLMVPAARRAGAAQ